MSRLLMKGLAAAVAVLSPAAAQQPPARPATIAAEPSATAASYGDWVLKCQRIEAARFCEIVQTLTFQGQANPIAQIAIGRLSPKEKLRLTIAAPTNISFTGSPRIEFEDKSANVRLAWSRCLPGSCFAEATLGDDLLKPLRAVSKNGQLAFNEGSGREIKLPFSIKGMPQALDALAKE